jgi:membrane associated rhomboid family serine protease
MPIDFSLTLLTLLVIFFQLVFLFIPLGSDKISRGKVPQATITIAVFNTLIFILVCILKTDKEVESFYALFALAPYGTWRVYQTLTYAFMHGSLLHLLGNMIFFVALSVALEEFIGSNLFLIFYLLACIFSCSPFIIFPESAPLVGASGAISAIMGAFLVLFYKNKIKIGWISLPLYPFLLLFRKKGHGIIYIPAYIVLPYFFFTDVLMWHFFRQQGVVSGTAHTVHIAGFIFGAGIALWLRNSPLLQPKIQEEAAFYKSYYKSMEVRRAIQILDKGDIQLAARKLLAVIEKNPNDVEAIEALIKLYQRISDYEQVKSCFIKLIQHHLSQGNKSAALQSYKTLLSMFPRQEDKPVLPVYEWMLLCDFMRQTGLSGVASFEYERLANAYPDTPNAVRACVQGGEAALIAQDINRAFRLFEISLTMNPVEAFEIRARRGIEKCNMVRSESPIARQSPATFDAVNPQEIISDRA